MKRLLAAVWLALAPAIAFADDPLPAPSPELPPAGSVDPRLVDPNTIVVRHTGGSLLGGLDAPHPQPQIHPYRLIAVPAGCLAVGSGAWAGLASKTGDAGTPAVEIGAGYAGAFGAAAISGFGLYAIDHRVFQEHTGLSIAVFGTLAPLASGTATFFATQELEGHARHPQEALGAAIAGAAAGELVTGLAAWACKTPAALGPMTVAFLPLGAGAALGERLARGRFGREKPLVRTPLVFVFRF